MINPKIKEEILKDIILCDEELTMESNSSRLYRQLVAKYSMMDKDFKNDIPNYVKTFGSTYTGELRVIKTKLETYLLLDDIPVSYNENVAKSAIVINTKSFKNSGSVGNNNKQTKEINVNASIKKEERKLGFLSKLLKWFTKSGK